MRRRSWSAHPVVQCKCKAKQNLPARFDMEGTHKFPQLRVSVCKSVRTRSLASRTVQWPDEGLTQQAAPFSSFSSNGPFYKLNSSIYEKCWKFIASKMLEIKSRHLTWVGPKCIKKTFSSNTFFKCYICFYYSTPHTTPPSFSIPGEARI